MRGEPKEKSQGEGWTSNMCVVLLRTCTVEDLSIFSIQRFDIISEHAVLYVSSLTIAKTLGPLE